VEFIIDFGELFFETLVPFSRGINNDDFRIFDVFFCRLIDGV